MDGIDPEVDPDTCTRLLAAIYELSRDQLTSSNFEFEPLLPDEHQVLAVRSLALGEWCTGFLFGLTMAGGVSLDTLPPDSREVVGDLSTFAHIRSTDSEDEDEEAAFLELVEYIRVGVMLISEELYTVAYESTSPTVH